MSFEEGLSKTVEWYKKYSGNWDDVETALVAHPRRGHTGKAWQGKPDDEPGAAAGGAAAGAGAV